MAQGTSKIAIDRSRNDIDPRGINLQAHIQIRINQRQEKQRFVLGASLARCFRELKTFWDEGSKECRRVATEGWDERAPISGLSPMDGEINDVATEYVIGFVEGECRGP